MNLLSLLRAPAVVIFPLLAFATTLVANAGEPAAAPQPAHVALVLKGEQHWELQVDAKPYVIKGVTFNGTGGPAAYDRDLARLAAIGVNTIRTWGNGADTPALLDAAQKNGIHVMLGLWLRHGQAGAEGSDSFKYINNAEGVSHQRASLLASVAKYKDHPALLIWGVGNEVFLNMPSDATKTAYAQALNDLCVEIKKIDPNHPCFSVDAFTKGVKWVEQFAPAVDGYGINAYGPAVGKLADALKKEGSTRPWIVTEFGSQGDWDAPKDANGVRIEASDTEKYRVILDGWKEVLAPQREAGRCLGLFIFNYSNSFTYTNLKHGLMINDDYRPAWYATREAYSGEKPPAGLPRISTFAVEADHSNAPAGWFTVKLTVTDASGQPPDISFAFNFRAATSRTQRDAITPLESRPGPTPDTWLIHAPTIKGPIKLYALVRDSQHTLVTATTSLALPLSQ